LKKSSTVPKCLTLSSTSIAAKVRDLLLNVLGPNLHEQQTEPRENIYRGWQLLSVIEERTNKGQALRFCDSVAAIRKVLCLASKPRDNATTSKAGV
jgi:hypothetical protein